MSKKALFRIIVVVIFAGALALVAYNSGIKLKDLSPSKLKQFLLGFGEIKGALIYLAIYTFSIRPFVPIPPTLYTFAGGFTFGPFLGTALTVTGATLNASFCFLIARWLGKEFVERLSKGKLAKLNERLENGGFKTLIVVRTSPVGPPFDLVSYVSGLLRISFLAHFFATMLGVIPAVFAYSYLGGSITKGAFAILVGVFLVVLISILLPWYLKKRKHTLVPNS